MTFAYDFEWPTNKYMTRYLSLIDSAIAGKWTNYIGYTERHHIVPKSMGGGNGKSNIVVLPVWLHYHAHYWLMKAFPLDSTVGRSMIAAFRKMNIARDYQERPTKARLYEEMRSRAKLAGSGRKMSAENKAKLIASKLGVPRSDKTKALLSKAHTGKKLSEEHRRAISESLKGRKDSAETKEKRAAHHRGAVRSDETRTRMREGRRLAKERREKEHQTFTSSVSAPSSPKTDM